MTMPGCAFAMFMVLAPVVTTDVTLQTPTSGDSCALVCADASTGTSSDTMTMKWRSMRSLLQRTCERNRRGCERKDARGKTRASYHARRIRHLQSLSPALMNFEIETVLSRRM